MSNLITKAVTAALLAALALASPANAATWGVNGEGASLPPCPKAAKATWYGCIGALTLPDGTTYAGEFRHGKPDGLGQYDDANRAGEGAISLHDGSSYVGRYRKRLPNGEDTLTLPDDVVYVGEFRDRKLEGQGTHTKPDGRKYAGEFQYGEIVSAVLAPPSNFERYARV